jgi:hypothetical protein
MKALAICLLFSLPCWAQDFRATRWSSDHMFVSLAGVNAVVIGLDGYSTVSRIGADQVCHQEIWMPSLYGRDVHPGRVAAVMGTEFATEVLASYSLRKAHAPKWLWMAPMAGTTVSHSLGALHNFRRC